jgi:hypothetical protein
MFVKPFGVFINSLSSNSTMFYLTCFGVYLCIVELRSIKGRIFCYSILLYNFVEIQSLLSFTF